MATSWSRSSAGVFHNTPWKVAISGYKGDLVGTVVVVRDDPFVLRFALASLSVRFFLSALFSAV